MRFHSGCSIHQDPSFVPNSSLLQNHGQGFLVSKSGQGFSVSKSAVLSNGSSTRSWLLSFDSKTRSKFRNNAGWARDKGASLGYSEIKSIIISLKLFLRFCLVFKSVPSYPLNTDFNVLKKTFENFFCPLKPFLYGCRLKWRIKNFFWGVGRKERKEKRFLQ